MRSPLRSSDRSPHRSLRRTVGQGLCLAVLGAGLAGTPLLVGTAAAAPDDSPAVAREGDPGLAEAQRESRGLLAEMRGAAEGSVRVSSERATGLASFVRAGTGGDLLPAVDGDRPGAKAAAYLDQYAGAFGAASEDLVRTDVTTDDLGTTITFTQEHDGVGVFGSLLRAHLDADGDLTAVNGQAVPVEGVPTRTRLSADEAAGRAVELVRSDPPGHAEDGEEAGTPTGLRAAETTLQYYREGLVKGETGGSTDLVYVTEVVNGTDVRDMVFFSATTGKLVNRYSMVHDALERRVYEQSPDTEPVWEEGDSLEGLTPDQRSIVEASGEAYWFFANAFGRDSYDGAGAAMETVNNDPTINCPNANWNGVTTNYCNGVTSDDVVAHEWGHAYTEYTHGLIYQWQPGALNEAYSDIWGETVDLINERQDEGEDTGRRADGLCSSSSPSVPLLSITAPASIAKDCATGGASFGAQVTAEGITGEVVAATDVAEPAGTLPAGTTTDGCSAYDQDVTDKIVIVDRGRCPFTEKAARATEEGAAALVIGNNVEAPISMSGDEPDYVTTVSIGLSDRQSIRNALAAGETVEVTIRDAAGERSDSDRWLVGEQSTAFGGAIRDMWSPTCYGDPGKVSDVEYKCSTDDAGGVHSNSGVPNHGYALLVDGGTSNGVTVEGIGMDKAAAVYFRAMDAYQTPSSKFGDHVDALQASCADLTGKRIYELSVATDDRRALGEDGKITAADCAQIAPMAEATEMREEPVQCDFAPLLGKDAPALCGAGTVSDEVFSEDFESGLGDWTLAGDNVYDGPLRDWKADTSAPKDANGAAAYGPAGDLGQCDASTNDFSSVNTMTSPAITVGEEGQEAAGAPRMSFRHLVATEVGFDGGNVQVAVNGGDFAPVPAEAFVYNEPSVLATEAEGNTNPLAGQPGFTGTDGGEVSGSWGTSVVDLGAAGVAAGDEVQLRFAIGRDGCGGVDGWYVDDVAVSLCEVGATVDAAARPAVVQYGRGATVDVSVEGNSTAPSGEVSLVSGDRTYGTETLGEDGSATFALPKRLAVGTYDMDVVYAGDDTYGETVGEVQVTVGKATTTTTLTGPASATANRRLTMDVDVASTFVPPSGTVVIRRDGRQVGQGFVRNGEATVRLSSPLPAGRQTLVAAYAGNGNFRASRGTVTVRVTR